jgi:hypothetical protein
VLAEQYDDWIEGRRYLGPRGSRQGPPRPHHQPRR